MSLGTLGRGQVPASAARLSGLGHREQQRRGRNTAEHPHQVTQDARRGQPLGQDSGQQWPGGAADRLGKGCEQCGVPPIAFGIELDERRRCRATGHANRDTLHDARREQPGNARCQGEQAQRDRARDEPTQDHGSATDPVGELSEEQQRRCEHERVDGEDECEDQAVEAEALAIHAVQRRRQIGAQKQRGERACHDRLAGCRPESERHESEITMPPLRLAPDGPDRWIPSATGGTERSTGPV
jgi:hypothetical protein